MILNTVRAHKVEQIVLLQHFDVAITTRPEGCCDVQTSRAVVQVHIVGNRVTILV